MSANQSAEEDALIRARSEAVTDALAVGTIEPLQGWWNLCTAINIHDTKGNYILEYLITETAGWKSADPDTKQAIEDLAFAALQRWPTLRPEDKAHQIVGTSGFMAVQLFADSAPERLDNLSESEWSFWLPGIIDSGASLASRSHLQRLLCIGYGRFPDTILAEAASLLRNPQRTHGASALTWAFGECWDQAARDLLAGTLPDNSVPHQVRVAVLRSMLENEDPAAAPAAFGWITNRANDGALANAAVQVLFQYGDADAITQLKSVLEVDHAFARAALLENASVMDQQETTLWRMSIALQADLYLLLEELFPTADDPKHRRGGDYEPTPRDHMATFRDGLIRQVAGSGSWEALDELERAAAAPQRLALPHLLWHEAERAALRATWSAPFEPRSVLEFASDTQRRILRSSEQLRDLVLEALGRLQRHLTVGGAVADLWSEWKVGQREVYRPKLELAFADYVKRFLDCDLRQYTILNNREVENRRGNETDILVEYMDREGDGVPRRLAVVIEVKGAWHRDLFTAMETQLAGRYLVDYQTHHGIYLVGWYQCNRWESTRRERRKPVGHTLDSLRQKLIDQASQLSNDKREVDAIVLDAAWPLPNVPRR